MTNNLDLNALREIASAATAGPWELDVDGWISAGARYVVMADEHSDPDTIAPVIYRNAADAAHIAAFDPPTALALIERAEAAEVGEFNAQVMEKHNLRRAEAAEATVARVEALAEEFHSRLPDGTGNGRPYNSHEVARRIRAALEGSHD